MIEKERIQQANLATNERIQQAKQREWRLETGDRRGGDNQIEGKQNKEKNGGFEGKKESGRRWLPLGLRFENQRM